MAGVRAGDLADLEVLDGEEAASLVVGAGALEELYSFVAALRLELWLQLLH